MINFYPSCELRGQHIMYGALVAVSLFPFGPLSVTHLLARNSSYGNSQLSSGTPLLTANRLHPFPSLFLGRNVISLGMFQKAEHKMQSRSNNRGMMGKRLATHTLSFATLRCKALDRCTSPSPTDKLSIHSAWLCLLTRVVLPKIGRPQLRW